METVRTITLHAQEVKKEKQCFIVCSTEINGIWYKVKFTKECEGAPKKKGLYDLTIDFDECSVEKGKWYPNKDGVNVKSNDIIWVRSIAGLRMYTDDDLKQSNRVAMAAIFGE